MKKYLAMLLVFALLAGSLFCFAEDLEPEEMEIVIADDETEAGDEQEAVAEAEGLLLDAASGQEGEKTKGDDGETILAFEVDEEQGSADLEEEDTEAERTYAASNSSNVVIGDYSYSIDNGVATITGYKGSATSLVLPDRVTYGGSDYVVVGIGNSAFKGYNNLQAVTIPSSMNSLGNFAFENCVNLTSVTIKGDLKKPYMAFRNTGSSVGGFKVVFEDGVTSIPGDLFNTSSSKVDNQYAHVVQVIMSDSITTIGSSAFKNCYDLAEIHWGNGLISIEGSAFVNATSITKIVLPKTINSIGNYAFENCVNLKSVSINGNLKKPYMAFRNTGGSSGGFEVEFGNGVTSIPADLFNTSSSQVNNEYAHVTKATIPNTVTSIGDAAFKNCYDLVNINWGSGLQSIGGSAFSNDCGLKEIVLPDEVTTIGQSAFANCSNLMDVIIPRKTNTLGNYAFENCVNLTSVTIKGDLKKPYCAFRNTGRSSGGYKVVFGDEVTSIPGDLFNSSSSKVNNEYAHVIQVTISDSVTAIGGCAFKNCYDLVDVHWGKGLLSIGEGAFANDSSLTTVVLHKKLNSLGNYAFENCVGLTAVTINGDLKRPYCSFRNSGSSSGGYEVAFGNGVTSIPNDMFSTSSSKVANEYAHVTKVTIPLTVTAIGNSAFMNCYDLVYVTYAGSQSAWNSIAFGNNNECLLNANITFGSGGTVIATGVTLSQTSLSLSPGATATLTAAVEPADTTDKGIAWTSDNEDVATVSDGRVTAVGVGRATVTATSTSNPKKSASCEVTVTESTIAVTGVTISQSTLSLNVGGTATLTASVQPSGAPQGVVWSSDDTAVATVSASGVVKAVATGKATVTATSVSDSSRKATCAVTVSSGAILATSIALDREELTLRVGESATLTRTILPEHITTKKGNYQVSDKSVFIVEGSSISGNTCVYTLRGVGVGTAKLTVKTKDGTNLSATCAVTVLPDIPEKDLVRTGSNGTVKINKGEKLQLVASFATKKGWKIKSVSSNNKKVAAVDSAGLVTAKKAGTATITVKTSNKKKATVKIEVVDPTVPTKVVLNKTGTVKLKKGKTLQLTATVYPDTAETTLKWSSSSKKLATVTSDGLVKAKKKGTATITVKTGNGKKAKVKIKIV